MMKCKYWGVILKCFSLWESKMKVLGLYHGTVTVSEGNTVVLWHRLYYGTDFWYMSEDMVLLLPCYMSRKHGKNTLHLILNCNVHVNIMSAVKDITFSEVWHLNYQC